ncbi:hypothetical protein T06_11544 [Trichinella sp. T6]|nr:hypothetical protein T06_13175 [Trichinella sp. T6]KRX70172.1 hypothetical protein T06_11544 [Trichinella sp. T6]
MKGADLEESAFQIQGRNIMNKFFLSACCIATDIARCVMNFHRIRSCLNLRCIVRLDHSRSSSAGDKSLKTLRPLGTIDASGVTPTGAFYLSNFGFSSMVSFKA